MDTSKDSTWWIFTMPALLGADAPSDALVILSSLLLAIIATSLLTWASSPGGVAWKNGRGHVGRQIPGSRGLPVLGSLLSLSRGLPHRALASMARTHNAKDLMAFSIGDTPAVVSSDPAVAREILCHSDFANRPLKQSARELMFGRAIGFAPSGSYWRLLRRVAALHLFMPRRIAAHEPSRQADCDAMVREIAKEQRRLGFVRLRHHLQGAALNNIMGCVFGMRYDVSVEGDSDLQELRFLVREGFELLSAFNWSDHLPWLCFFYDPDHISRRCAALVPRVRRFVSRIIEQHKAKSEEEPLHDFVDVLLSLEGEEKLEEQDMIAILWEMVFRGTDTTALLTEWTMAELVRHPEVQRKLRSELDSVDGPVADAVVARLPYLQAVVKETLRHHPPGPLLSWARMSTSDVHLSNGMVVPGNTTAMVNLWSITHDPAIWAEPDRFLPERFVVADGGLNVDVGGADMILAPFGAGRRVCPGKNLGMVAVRLWVARLIREFEWKEAEGSPVDLSETLKLTCQMKTPLTATATERHIS